MIDISAVSCASYPIIITGNHIVLLAIIDYHCNHIVLLLNITHYHCNHIVLLIIIINYHCNHIVLLLLLVHGLSYAGLVHGRV